TSLWQMNGLAIQGTADAGSLGADWQTLGSGDFNGDGKADILWHRSSDGALGVWVMNGANITAGERLSSSTSAAWSLAAAG
ncbi:MAG TPA: VCBS repeat-containing protein, partial [Rhizomicrobium sp.]|nr:VCBS repeat-containing protein [Rhizomicrobium sp.]